MAISRARHNFRRFLLVLLGASFGFAATASYFYVMTRNDPETLKEISPTLFQIDVLQAQARSNLMSQDERFILANNLIRRGFYSEIYYKAGVEMIVQLSEEGYAPAQTMHGNFLLSTNVTPEKQKQALELFQLAAAQDYEPAINRLTLFKYAAPLASKAQND